MLSNKTP